MDAFIRSLELVAEREVDPAPRVYANLFSAHPALEALFVLDRSGLVRGQMLQVAFERLLDLAGDRAYAMRLLRAERVNHQGLGVPPEAFDQFYPIVLATFREIAGADWTAEMEAAWATLLEAATPIG